MLDLPVDDIDTALAAPVTGKPPAQTEFVIPMPADVRQFMEATQRGAKRAGEGGGFWGNTITEVAVAQGTQYALMYRYQQIVQRLDDRAAHLDTIVDFGPFILEGKILIPSVQVVHAKQDKLSDLEMVEVKAQFTIEEEAKLVTAAPTWRDYLVKTFPHPGQPPIAALPKNSDEQQLWAAGVQRGWRLGIGQAGAIFRDSLAEMLRDIRGRQMYLDLERMNRVSFPTMDRSQQGITFTGRTMNSGEIVYTLTRPGNWQPTGMWRAFWQDPEEADYDRILREVAFHE